MDNKDTGVNVQELTSTCTSRTVSTSHFIVGKITYLSSAITIASSTTIVSIIIIVAIDVSSTYLNESNISYIHISIGTSIMINAPPILGAIYILLFSTSTHTSSIISILLFNTIKTLNILFSFLINISPPLLIKLSKGNYGRIK